MKKEDLIEKSLVHLVDNKMDYETQREFWQKKVTKTHLKLISLAFESKIHKKTKKSHEEVQIFKDQQTWCSNC